VAAKAPADGLENPAMLLDYLVDRMLAGYEQDDDVTVLVVHSPRRDVQVPARRVGGTQAARVGGSGRAGARGGERVGEAGRQAGEAGEEKA
jgi:hypothetical protein